MRLLTCAMASKRGRLSHLRRAKDLMQRVTSPGVMLATWGCRSVASFWKTWGWWKFSFPLKGQKEERKKKKRQPLTPSWHGSWRGATRLIL